MIGAESVLSQLGTIVTSAIFLAVIALIVGLMTLRAGRQATA